MSIELKEIYVNLKNHEFDLLGDYKIDENEAKKLMKAIEEVEGELNGKKGTTADGENAESRVFTN